MDEKKLVRLCNDMFFCGAGAAPTLKNMVLSGGDVFNFFAYYLVTINECHEVADKAELLKALKELEPKMREHIQKANEENIKESKEKFN